MPCSGPIPKQAQSTKSQVTIFAELLKQTEKQQKMTLVVGSAFDFKNSKLLGSLEFSKKLVVFQVLGDRL